MTVRAKFYCSEKSQTAGQGDISHLGAIVKMRPVVSSSDNAENAEFFKWTPYGELTMGVVSQEVADQFELGKSYYLDFMPV